MKISEFSVKKPVTISMVFILILILGIITFKALPMDILPKMEIPALTVFTIYPGANPNDIETKITDPLEKRLSTINGLKNITSTSFEGISTITLNFNWGTNLESAANDVRTQLDFANMSLPDDAQKPTLIKFDFSQAPISFWGLSINPELKHPQKYIQKNIVDRLMRVKGVGLVFSNGIPDEVVAIGISRKKLEKYNLDMNMVNKIISGYNLSIPGGSINLGRRYIVVRTNGEYDSIEAISKIPILRMRNKTILLKDIATVKFGNTREVVAKVRINSQKGAILFIQKASGENTVRVEDAAEKEIKSIQKDIGNNVKINLVLSLAGFIKDTINSLKNTLLFSVILIVLVVLIMLGNIRGAIIISLSLPFSLIISFIFMYLFGYTINMMSMGALVLAAGMIVDSAIVIFENIHRHRYTLGEPLKEASIFAPGEVGMAVTASILTTVAIFFPLIFIKGLVGVMFKQLGVIVTIVLLGSLFTSLTLIPALSYILLPKNKRIGKLEKATINIWSKVGDWLGKLIRNSLKKGVIWVSLLLLLFFVSLILLKYVPKEFMPETDMGRIEVNMQLPAMVNINETEKVAKKIEELIYKNVPEKKILFTNAGANKNMMVQSVSPNNLQVVIRLPEKNTKRRPTEVVANQIKKLIVDNIAGYKNFNVSTADPMTESMGGSSGSGAVLEIYGDDLNKMYNMAKQWKKLLLAQNEVRNVDISYESGKKELDIIPRKDRDMEFGLTPAQIGMFVRSILYGTKVGVFRKSGNVFDIYTNYNISDVDTISKLKSIYISTPTGKKVQLGDLVDLKWVKGPVNIDRKNRQRIISVTAILKQSRFLGKVTNVIKNNMNKMKETGLSYKIGGNAKDMQDSFKSLIQILLLAIVLVFMVMASQFESLKEPFIIFFSVPFAMTGAFLGLWITHETLSVNSMVGIIMLIGIVVNNAIVLVDYMNTLRKRGIELKDAIEQGVSNRLRPVLMTAITTIFGMVPLAVATGVGSESWRPLGIAVIGGLTLSTIFTFVLVPNVYYFFERKSKVEQNAIY